MPSTMTSAREAGGTHAGVRLSGAVRDVYSREILYNAQPNLIFAQFADRRTELQRESGDTIKFTKYHDLHGSSKLSEVEPIQTTNISSNQVNIQVDEHGYGVSESERILRTAWDDTASRIVMLLGQHYGRSVDGLLRREIISAGSLQSVYAKDRATRADLVPADTFDVQAIKDAAEILAVEKAPKIGGAYICAVHPHVARSLRDDAEWIEAHKYTQGNVDNIYRGEIGMMEGVRFIETTHTTIITQSTGVVVADREATGAVEALSSANTAVYQSPIFGANGVGWAEALPVEFRTNGVIDFNRKQELCWYSIMGAGQIRPENIALIESA